MSTIYPVFSSSVNYILKEVPKKALSPLKKKIVLIALAIFTLYSIGFIIYRCHINAVKINKALNPTNLKFMPFEMQNNHKVVEVAVEKDGLALEFASDEQRDNYIIVATAVRNNPKALQFASDRVIKMYDRMVKRTVERDGLVLEFASDEQRDDYDIVLKAVQNNPKALQFASPRLIKHIDLLKEANRPR